MWPLLDLITAEKWNVTVKNLSNNSAPEPSGINYSIIKKLLTEFTEIIIQFINHYYTFSLILTRWKVSNIILILKPQLFAFDILNTRPIALLKSEEGAIV